MFSDEYSIIVLSAASSIFNSTVTVSSNRISYDSSLNPNTSITAGPSGSSSPHPTNVINDRTIHTNNKPILLICFYINNYLTLRCNYNTFRFF